MPAFLVSLLLMVLALAVAIGVDWPTLRTATVALYLGLLGLAVYMLWRGERAWWLARRRPNGWLRRYLDHIGFVLISLFDGFTVVVAIDLGAPVWLVACIAVAGVAAGIGAIGRVKASTLPHP